MRKLGGLLLLLALAVAPAHAQKITIDYARDFDFEPVKTFQYVDTKDSNASDPLMNDRIRNAIIRELQEGGLTQVKEDPDLYITYHVAAQDNTVYNTTSFGYGGYGYGWGGWGGGVATSTTTAMTYTEGTLIIDAYEPEEKKMIWRGKGTVTLKNKPEKRIKQIDAILTKMGNKWDKILANQGK